MWTAKLQQQRQRRAVTDSVGGGENESWRKLTKKKKEGRRVPSYTIRWYLNLILSSLFEWV